MAGKSKAVRGGAALADLVLKLGEELGLEVKKGFKVGRRIWGAERYIDVILIHQQTRKTLGIECKYQATTGSAEEKIPSAIDDIKAWPIPGLVVFAGEGFSKNIRHFLISTGKAIEFDDLRPWLCLFFGLPLQDATPEKKKTESLLPGLD
jgi:hypothetical protein